ncbi:MAG: hypothetical protein WHS65_11840 [Melioribacteraceae bacterium]
MTCINDTNKDSLDLILHTPGGDYEATKRIINYLHETFKHIRVFIPHMAMSGGTLIACAADEIVMGPYSSLGPTDPQIFLDENYIPVSAVIDEFELAFNEISKDPTRALLWSERLRQIPFGKIKAAQNMERNSLKYLIDLLKKRNCKGLEENKVKNLAEYLNSGRSHSSHGRGISLKDAIENGLNVLDLRKDKIIEDDVLSIYHSAIILFEKTPVQKIIINHMGKKYISHYQG